MFYSCSFESHFVDIICKSLYIYFFWEGVYLSFSPERSKNTSSGESFESHFVDIICKSLYIIFFGEGGTPQLLIGTLKKHFQW